MSLFSFFSQPRPDLLLRSLDDLVVMVESAGQMYAAATAHLLDNERLLLDLSAMDAEINETERRIRESVLKHVRNEPDEQLALSLLLISVVQDAERCGDLAKSLAKAARLADKPRMGPHVERLRLLRDRVQALFPVVSEAFAREDESAARRVMLVHNEVKREGTAYLESLAQAADLSPNLAVVLSVSSRMITRTSSHLSNIISVVAMPFDQIRRSPTWDE